MNQQSRPRGRAADSRVLRLLAVIMLLLASCSPTGGLSQPIVNTPEPAPTAAPEATATAEILPTQPAPTEAAAVPDAASVDVEGLFEFPENVNPLTGLIVPDPSRLERRPILVKVSNFPRTGRPHAGLSFADIVFEYYIGYGLNRFMGMYLGQDSPQTGPVRSGRLVDAQLAEMYQSFLFYGNADPQVDEVILAEIGARALAEKWIPTPPKYRIGKVLDETTLFVNTAELTDYVNRKNEVSNGRRDLRGMIFSDAVHPVNAPATRLNVQFWTTTRGEWQYDPATGKYLRWIEDVTGDNQVEMIPLVDRLTDQQLSFSNIIILFATYVEYAPTLHDIRVFDNTDGKRALFFRDGVMIEGSWKAVSAGRPIQFFNSWGNPMHLKPGNSWIVLTGDSSKFSEPEPGSGSWDLRFDLP